MKKGIAIIAHRGASSKHPENTLSAIRHAIGVGADFVEIDVHLSSDGIPVVIHDNTLCRTTNAEKGKKIREMHSDQFKRYDAGAWFRGATTLEKVPTLEEVLALDFGKTGLMIEIKDDINHDLSTAVFSILQNRKVPNLLIGSFSALSVSYFHDKFPRFKLIGIADQLDSIKEFEKVDLDYIAIAESLLNQNVMQEINAKYSAIWAYTVDDLKRGEELMQLGISGLITNDPEVWI
ncbi:MAG: glycerophosphodiester phosphodiesterase [Parachlamydiaceae bacterium]